MRRETFTSYELAIRHGYSVSCPYEWQLLEDYIVCVIDPNLIEYEEDDLGDRILRKFPDTKYTRNILKRFF